MFQIAWGVISWLIDKWSANKIKAADNQLERDKIQAEVEQNKDKWKAVILTSTGAWWFQLFFIVPLALWFASVVLYSIFWCNDCMFPQTWTIAALPSPLNDWAAAIIGFLFLTKVAKS